MDIVNSFIDYWNITPASELFVIFIGYTACVAMVLGYLPQTIRTIRTGQPTTLLSAHSS